jgi:hypothetical protein
MARHQAMYPRRRQPQLRDFADFLCAMRDRFPDAGYLHAAIIDARTAFQLFKLSFNKFRLVWTAFKISRASDWEDNFRGHVAGTFGDIGAGDVWDQFGDLLDEIHNNASALFKSMTYVDDMFSASPPFLSDMPDHDGIVYRWEHLQKWLLSADTVIRYAEDGPSVQPLDINARDAILDAVPETRDNLACLFGLDSSEDRKVKLTIGFAEVVGWYFDLRYVNWFVRPLDSKIEKMAHYLFNVIPEHATTVDVHHMETLPGLLCWFSVAMPLGKSFVYSLFQCRRTGRGQVTLHPTAYAISLSGER